MAKYEPSAEVKAAIDGTGPSLLSKLEAIKVKSKEVKDAIAHIKAMEEAMPGAPDLDADKPMELDTQLERDKAIANDEFVEGPLATAEGIQKSNTALLDAAEPNPPAPMVDGLPREAPVAPSQAMTDEYGNISKYPTEGLAPESPALPAPPVVERELSPAEVALDNAGGMTLQVGELQDRLAIVQDKLWDQTLPIEERKAAEAERIEITKDINMLQEAAKKEASYIANPELRELDGAQEYRDAKAALEANPDDEAAAEKADNTHEAYIASLQTPEGKAAEINDIEQRSIKATQEVKTAMEKIEENEAKEIDPRRAWSKNRGSMILASLGAGLIAYGNTISGRGDPQAGLKYISNIIDRDIQAQMANKADMSKALKTRLVLFKSKEAALLSQKAAMMDAVIPGLYSKLDKAKDPRMAAAQLKMAEENAKKAKWQAAKAEADYRRGDKPDVQSNSERIRQEELDLKRNKFEYGKGRDIVDDEFRTTDQVRKKERTEIAKTKLRLQELKLDPTDKKAVAGNAKVAVGLSKLVKLWGKLDKLDRMNPGFGVTNTEWAKYKVNQDAFVVEYMKYLSGAAVSDKERAHIQSMFPSRYQTGGLGKTRLNAIYNSSHAAMIGAIASAKLEGKYELADKLMMNLKHFDERMGYKADKGDVVEAKKAEVRQSARTKTDVEKEADDLGLTK